MKSFSRFNAARMGLVGAVLLMASSVASATTLGDIATSFQTQLGSFADVVLGVLFLAGIVIGGLAAFKFKAHSDNPQQNKITTPLMYAVVAAILIGLPAFLNMAKDTTLGQGAQGNSINGGYDTIGQ